MLFTFIAWIYITCICWIWGTLIIALVNKSDKSNSYIPHFSITCLIGLSLLQTAFSYFSLITNINSIFIHCTIIIISLFLLLFSVYYLNKRIIFHLSKLSPINWILLITSLLVILVMSTWYILHPDTLIYHAAIIQSIENDGIIIGYAQKKIHYGLNSSWFIACGLFSFKFLGSNALTFINTTVVAWFLIFIVDKIQKCLYCHRHEHIKNNSSTGLLWLLLLTFSFLDYTQVRLTVTSASPDFIVAIYIWTIIYLFYKENLSKPILFLLLYLSIVSLTLKLSAFPIVAFIFYLIYLLIRKSSKSLILVLIISTFVFLPFTLRNIYTSGYAFFPSSFPNIFNLEWKLEDDSLHKMNKYIKAYARTKSESNPEIVKQVNNLSLYEWLPIWWEQKNFAQKILITLLPFCFLFISFKIRYFLSVNTKKDLILLSLSMIGITIWFNLAPDPRFGLSFLIPFLAISIKLLFDNYLNKVINTSIVVRITACLCFILLLYLFYRFDYYFVAKNCLLPFGLKY